MSIKLVRFMLDRNVEFWVCTLLWCFLQRWHDNDSITVTLAFTCYFLNPFFSIHKCIYPYCTFMQTQVEEKFPTVIPAGVQCLQFCSLLCCKFMQEIIIDISLLIELCSCFHFSLCDNSMMFVFSHCVVPLQTCLHIYLKGKTTVSLYLVKRVVV